MKEIHLDPIHVYRLLEWNTRRCLYHEIAESHHESKTALTVCLALDISKDYLIKEARTRIRRQCEVPRPWQVDEESFGAWFR
jgi:hypothetical protein